jgi:nucleoside-diphosphate-sugar epimerase
MTSLLKKFSRPIRRRLNPAPFVARRILLTGAAGQIGQPVGAELVRRGYSVRAMDRVGALANSPMQEWVTGDIGDPTLLDAAMTDIDVVVHLAGVLEDRAFEPDLIETNIRGAYRVFESARQHGVRRMIFASSVLSVFWQTVGRERPLGTDSTFAPLDMYAVTKIFGEQLGWLYGNQYGLPTIAIRFGWLPRNEENQRKLENSPDYHDWYLSPGDAARSVALAVAAPAERVGKFAVAYIASKPKGAGPFDLRPARRLLGYVPQDQYKPAA